MPKFNIDFIDGGEAYVSDFAELEEYDESMDRKHILCEMIDRIKLGEDISLNGLNLNNSDLTNMNLEGLDFTSSDLSECFITNCNLNNTIFKDCNLACSNFKGSSMVGTVFDGTDQTGTTGL